MSTRMTLPFAICNPSCAEPFSESRPPRLERKVGDKFKAKFWSELLANKYHKERVTRALTIDLKVSDIAKRKANGASLLGEIVAGFRPVILALIANVSSQS